MKTMYKHFVVMISDAVIDPKKMYGIEKQINDIMELISFHMN